MATGTSVAVPTLDWTVQHFNGSPPDPTIVSGGVQINFGTGGVAGGVTCLVGDPSPAIPSGATINRITATYTAKCSSATSSPPTVHQCANVGFATASVIDDGGLPNDLGFLGSGGPGDLPFDTSPHEITYDSDTYALFSPIDEWVAAIGAPDPLGMVVSATGAQNGQYVEVDEPWTFTIYWEADDESVTTPPLRLYPRSDGLGASSAKRLYPPSRSIQGSNRLTGYL